MSEDPYGIGMTEGEIAEYLTAQGHGVLSFAGELPYAIPLSFGYDEQENRCIFQLFFSPESRKEAALAESDEVNLVVYNWTRVDSWRSVVIRGRLTPIETDRNDETDFVEVFADHGSVVGTEVFNRPLEELESTWYELQVRDIRGYKSPMLN